MKHANGHPFSDGKCLMCNSDTEENLEHLLFYCSNSRRIWKAIQSLISKFTGKTIIINNIIATTGFWQTEVNEEILILNMICSITRFHIWKVRCKVKYGKEVIDFHANIRILRCDLQNHLVNLMSSNTNKATIQSIRRLNSMVNDTITV